MGDRGDHRVIGRELGRDLDANVRFALVVEGNHLVLILGLGVLVAQPDREIGRIPPAEADRRGPAGERRDEADLDHVLSERARAGEHQRQAERGKRRDSKTAVHGGSSLSSQRPAQTYPPRPAKDNTGTRMRPP